MSDRKFKLLACLVFEIKGAKEDKIFKFLNSRFSVTGGPMDIIFGVFSDLSEASKKYHFPIFLKI